MTTELINGQLPSDWELVEIGQKFTFTTKPKGLNFEDREIIHFAPMERIPSDRLYFSDFVLKAPQEISSGTYFEDGDLLLSKITPCFENGKQGIATKMPEGFGIATTEVIPIKAIEGVSYLPFLAMYLLDRSVRNSLAGKMEGATGRQRLAKSVLKDWKMPFPPLPEQRAIAAVLSKIQAVMEVQDKIVATLKELKAATMAKLFREGIIKGWMFDSNVFDDLIDGKLDISGLPTGIRIFITHIQSDELNRCPESERRQKLQGAVVEVSEAELPTESFVLGVSRLNSARLSDGGLFEELRGSSLKNTNDALIAETAIKEGLILVTNDKELMGRVRAAKNECISSNDLIYGRLRPMKQTDIGEMPESWDVVRVGEYCEKPRYGYTESACSAPVGPKFLRITDITEYGVYWNSVPYCPCPQKILGELQLKPGDLVFARIGATTGKSYLITDCPEAVFASYLIRLRAKPGLDYGYLSCFFESEAYWQQVRANKGSNLKGGMSASILANLLFPLTTLEEQKEIAAILKSIEVRIALAVKQRNAFKILFSSMLHLLMTGRVRVNAEKHGTVIRGNNNES